MILGINNDLGRFSAKMSEHLPVIQNSLPNQLKVNAGVSVKGKKLVRSVQREEDLKGNDHKYASNTGSGLELSELLSGAGCQNSECEVKFWKEWLILHLDLIQHQNDEISTKERTIHLLQQENDMLKEKISCLERGIAFEPAKNDENSVNDETMTQGSVVSENNALELVPVKCENGQASDGESQMLTSNCTNYQCGELKEESDSVNTSAELINYSLTKSETEPDKDLKMSIKKKRLSNSSALSNNDLMNECKRPFRRYKKRRKRVIKDSSILTTFEHYVTEAGEIEEPLADLVAEVKSRTLEVPRWRLKVYASCYSMEGTENLDDDVYNKRHIRLENDERRRKRWDVQRIREQRVIEKLKQRQDRISSGGRSDEHCESIQSVWPKVEDVKFLEVNDTLPVSAFGCPLLKVTPSDFNLPWLDNPDPVGVKKPTGKASAKRKTSRR